GMWLARDLHVDPQVPQERRARGHGVTGAAVAHDDLDAALHPRDLELERGGQQGPRAFGRGGRFLWARAPRRVEADESMRAARPEGALGIVRERSFAFLGHVAVGAGDALLGLRGGEVLAERRLDCEDG